MTQAVMLEAYPSGLCACCCLKSEYKDASRALGIGSAFSRRSRYDSIANLRNCASWFCRYVNNSLILFACFQITHKAKDYDVPSRFAKHGRLKVSLVYNSSAAERSCINLHVSNMGL